MPEVRNAIAIPKRECASSSTIRTLVVKTSFGFETFALPLV
jgi:hypothetical protein